ncbi:unnamed protein product, partial [Penicillium manginii]
CIGTTGECQAISRKKCKASHDCIQNCVDKAKSTTTTTTTTKKRATTTTTTIITTMAVTTTTRKKEPQTTTTTSKLPEQTWSITIYVGKHCLPENGDYIIVEGYTSDWSECVDLQSGDNSDMASGKTSCRLFKAREGTSQSCYNSGLTEPQSWWVPKGDCQIFSDAHCGSFNGMAYSDYRDSHDEKCQRDNAGGDSFSWPTEFGSVRCGHAA